MDHGLITQDPIPAGTPVPDQRGVSPHAIKTTAHPGPGVPNTPTSEGHNLAPPSDPDRDPEMGNPIGAEAPYGTEVPFTAPEGLGPQFRLGSGAARSRPIAGVRTALRYLPVLFIEHFLNLPYSAFYSLTSPSTSLGRDGSACCSPVLWYKLT